MPGNFLSIKAVKEVFNLISRKQVAQTLAPLYTAIQQLQLQVTTANANLGLTVYGYGSQEQQIKAYASIDDLYSVVNRVMKTAALIPLYEYTVVNKKAFGQYKIELKKYVKNPSNKALHELSKLQKKALELAGEDSDLQMFLDNPNKFQSKSQFYELTYLFKLLAGNYYLYKELLDLGANDGKVYEMYNLPPNWTYPIATESYPRRTAGYQFNLYSRTQIFDINQIIHGKYANPVYDFVGNELVGLSPLMAGAKTLTTISNETDYSNQALINAGAGGVMVNEDATELKVEALGQMRDDVLKDLGSNWQNGANVNVNKLGFLAGKWNYLKIFIDPANMQLLDQKKLTFKRLCNIYGVSDKLFNNDEGSKYDNYDIALRELYTNAALPLVSGLCDDFNMGLVQHFGGTSVVGYDVTDIPELSENITEVVNKFATAPAFRVNDLFESMGYGRLDDPAGEKVLVKQGYQLLDDIATPEMPVIGADYPIST